MRRLFCFSLLLISVAAGPALADFSSLKKDATRALKSGDMTTLASKVREIGQEDSKQALQFLLKMAKIPDGNVYKAAVDGISGMRSSEAEDFIRGKLERSGGNALEKMLMIDAMGKRGDKFAGEVLGAACSSRKPEVQRACISAIKSKKLLSGVSGLIDLLGMLEKGDEDALNLNLVRSTLQTVTGESFKTAADWKNFWEPRKDNYQRPKTGGVHKRDETARRKKPTFFGSEINSNRLVFVIDTSGSMEAADGGMMGTGRRGGPGAGGAPGGVPGAGGAPAGGGAANSRVRIERAKHQLISVIGQLPKKVRFTIVAYSGVMLMGPGGPVTPKGTSKSGVLPPKIGNIEWRKTWKPKLMAATEKNKKDAQAFVKGLKAEGGTFTLNALKAAFEVDGADTIVLLSDGMPNDFDFLKKKQLTPGDILADVQAMNRVKRRVIETFGFDAESGASPRRRRRGFGGGFRRGTGGGAPPAGFPGAGGGGGPAGGLGKFMQDLAGQNGGSYTQIK